MKNFWSSDLLVHSDINRNDYYDFFTVIYIESLSTRSGGFWFLTGETVLKCPICFFIVRPICCCFFFLNHTKIKFLLMEK